MAWTKKSRSMDDRNITGLLSGVLSGSAFLSRDEHTVWLEFQDLEVSPQGSGNLSWPGLLPAGFRPHRPYVYLPLPKRLAADTAGPVAIDKYCGISVYNHSGLVRGVVSFRTRQSMPTTFPGTAVS